MKESHYNKGGIEVIDFIRDQLTPEEFNGFCKGNILKYVPRSNHKGDPIADAQKVRDYADYWISANLRTNKVAELGQVSTEKAQELADTIVELRRECRSYVETLNVRNDEIEELKAKNDKYKVRCKELYAETLVLKDDKTQLEELNKVRGDQREKFQRENVKLKEELKELKDELRKSEEENVKASRERLNSVKMAEALRESVDRMQKENRSLKDAPEKQEKDSVADDLKAINYDKFKNA